MSESLRDQRRGQIISAARRLVAEQGLLALTIGALGARGLLVMARLRG